MFRAGLTIGIFTGFLVMGAVAPRSLAQSSACPKPKPCPKVSPPSPIPLRERMALIALYKSTNGEHWTDHENWLGPRGTECTWEGVECEQTDGGMHVVSLKLWRHRLDGAIPSEIGDLTQLVWMSLGENHLTGRIPGRLAGLNQLRMLDLEQNDLTGLLPPTFIRGWLNNTVDISADGGQLTDVSEIDYESSSTSVLCASTRFILSVDGTVTSYDVRCRNATPGDRTTYCEVKHGELAPVGFAELSHLIEKNGFFTFGPEYWRNITDSGFQNTRVTRRGNSHAVSSYAGAGPLELWGIELAIEGVANSADWHSTTTQPQCPRW